jgi:hypothetical protein
LGRPVTAVEAESLSYSAEKCLFRKVRYSIFEICYIHCLQYLKMHLVGASTIRLIGCREDLSDSPVHTLNNRAMYTHVDVPMKCRAKGVLESPVPCEKNTLTALPSSRTGLSLPKTKANSPANYQLPGQEAK